MTNQAKCTNCGAGLNINQGDKTCVCSFCQTTNIVENALALGKVEVDVTKDIQTLRTNLATFAQQNSIDEILRVSQKLLDWIPQDFVARYFFAYAKQQQNQPRFMYEFYQSPPTYTDDEITLVLSYINQHSDLRDKRRVLDFLAIHHEDGISGYLKIHKEREDKENHYANVPRDVFVCYSSYNVGIAERVVKELEADGNTCWISTRNLRPNDSENYWKNIENAIQNSTILLVIGSEDAMLSKDVHQEIDLARQYQKRIVEFKIDEVPHNTLFKHVFNGIKWVKGSFEVNQNYTVLLERIYEEKYQHPRHIQQESPIEEYYEPDDLTEDFISTDDFIASEEEPILDDTEESIDETTEKVSVDDVFFRQQINDDEKHQALSVYYSDAPTNDEKKYSSKFSLWVFTTIGIIVLFGFLINFGVSTYSNRTSNNPITNPIPTPTTPTVNDNQVISNDRTNINDSSSVIFFESIRTFEPISLDDLFLVEMSDVLDSIILKNGDIATIGIKENGLGYSLWYSVFNNEFGVTTHTELVNFTSNSLQLAINRDFFRLHQFNEERLIISYVNASLDDTLKIQQLGFLNLNHSGVVIEHKVLDVRNRYIGRFDSIDILSNLFDQNEISGDLVGLQIHNARIVILTSIMSPFIQPHNFRFLYIMDESFELENVSGGFLTQDRVINRTISSSYGNQVSFIGNGFEEITDNQLGYIRETRPVLFLYNLNNMSLDWYNSYEDSMLFESRRVFEGEAMNLNSIEGSVLRRNGFIYYVAKFLMVNPSRDGYLPPQYYFVRDRSGSIDFEIDINNMLNEIMTKVNSSGLNFNGIYYDELLEHFVLDIIFLSLDSSVNSIRYNVFVSTEGDLIGVQEFNWNNGSVLSSKYRNHVYEDGTILSTSERGILIQRVRD